MQNKKIAVVTCGGTIDKYQFVADIDSQVGTPQINAILEEGNATLDIELIEVVRKDSLNMTADDRTKIKQAVQQSNIDNILITHGTDGLVETAQYLQDITDKTIVLTGAMIPASLKRSDASFNIGSAIMAVQTLATGIYIVMNGRVFTPQQCKKDYEKGIFVAI